MKTHVVSYAYSTETQTLYKRTAAQKQRMKSSAKAAEMRIEPCSCMYVIMERLTKKHQEGKEGKRMKKHTTSVWRSKMG